MASTITPPTVIGIPRPRRALDEALRDDVLRGAELADVPAEVPVDVDALQCPGCGEDVAPIPPAYWVVADGLPAPAFSHLDRSPLCRTRGGVVAEPVESRWWPVAQLQGAGR